MMDEKARNRMAMAEAIQMDKERLLGRQTSPSAPDVSDRSADNAQSGLYKREPERWTQTDVVGTGVLEVMEARHYDRVVEERDKARAAFTDCDFNYRIAEQAAEAAEREVGRLQVALREIAETMPDECDLSHTDGGYDAGEIARDALEGEKDA